MDQSTGRVKKVCSLGLLLRNLTF